MTSSSDPKKYDTEKPNTGNKTTCSDWTTDQVQEWLVQNGLDEEPLAMYDGKCLTQMYTLSHRCPEYFHRSLETHLGMDLLAVVKFTIALDQLFQV